MMTMTENVNRGGAKSRDRYFLWFDLSAVLFVAWGATRTIGGGGSWSAVLEAGFLAMLVALFLSRRRDEFADHCWRRATSATFAMLIVSPLLLGFVDGLVDGFLDRPKVRSDVSVDALLALLFGTFFATFEWTRFREGRG